MNTVLTLTIYLLFLGGCTTILHPVGDWAEPVDLRISDDSLKNVAIGLECMQQKSGTNQLFPAHDQVCHQMETILTSMGAKVIGEQTQGQNNESIPNAEQIAQVNPTFTLRYRELPGQRDFCGWTLTPFILTLSLFPCIETISTSALIEIIGQDLRTYSTLPLHLELNTIAGIGALYYIGANSMRAEHRRNNRLRAGLILSVKNAVYSYALAQNLTNSDLSAGF